MGSGYAVHVEGDRWKDTFYREYKHEAIDLARMLRATEGLTVVLICNEATATVVEWE